MRDTLQRPWIVLATLWAFLIATYCSAHYTYYWWGFRNVGAALPFRLWQWQLLHVGGWMVAALAGTALLPRAIRRAVAGGWRGRDVGYAIALVATITAAVFLVDLFQPEAERQVRMRWFSGFFATMTEVVVPALVAGLLLLLVRSRLARRVPQLPD